MTREEQAQYISEKLMENPEFKKAFVGAITDAVNEAVKAIKALRQEPCTDAISRQAAIDALTKTSGIRGDALKALYDLPPVTAEKPNKWIPVSERLPELTINDSVAGKRYTEDVLVYDGADLRVGYFVRNDKLDFSYWVAYGEDDYKPIAWMPIEPYKASPTGAERSGEE